MNREEMITFANQHPVCFLSTNEDNKPHVRAMMLWYADETGFYFETLAPKDISRQLHRNPNMEVCFYNNPKDVMEACELRVAGQVEFIDDQHVIDKAYEGRKYLDELAGQSLKPYLEVFRVAHGDAHFWNLKSDVLREKILEHIHF